METADILCFLLSIIVCMVFIFDLLGASWAALKKKEYKSMIGSFVENLAESHSLWWFPVLIAMLFAYGIKVLYLG